MKNKTINFKFYYNAGGKFIKIILKLVIFWFSEIFHSFRLGKAKPNETEKEMTKFIM